ncbi:hypothetical protein ACHAWF_011024 [Thalassiosira exigua]
MLNIVTSSTLLASAIYNKAIALTNTEVISNSVIILFVVDIDELVYNILQATSNRWTENLTKGLGQELNDVEARDVEATDVEKRSEKCAWDARNLLLQLREMPGYQDVYEDDFRENEE